MTARSRGLVLAVLLALGLGTYSTFAFAQQPTFRTGTQIVSLFATVTDAQKRLVPDLQQADFDVFDNEKPQPIVYFDNSVHPINVVVMLDTSGSMTASSTHIRSRLEKNAHMG